MNLFGRKTFQNFLKLEKISNRSIKWLKITFCLMSAVKLVGVKILCAHLKVLEMRMQKLCLSVAQNGLALVGSDPHEL